MSQGRFSRSGPNTGIQGFSIDWGRPVIGTVRKFPGCITEDLNGEIGRRTVLRVLHDEGFRLKVPTTRMKVTGTVCPRTVELYALMFPHADTRFFQVFLDHANAATPEGESGISSGWAAAFARPPIIFFDWGDRDVVRSDSSIKALSGRMGDVRFVGPPAGAE